MPKLFTPGDDLLGTPLPSRKKCPVSRSNNFPTKKCDAPAPAKVEQPNPKKPAADKNDHHSKLSGKTTDGDFVKDISPGHVSLSPKETMKSKSNEPGPSVNKHERKSSSESKASDSDIEILTDEDPPPRKKYYTRSTPAELEFNSGRYRTRSSTIKTVVNSKKSDVDMNGQNSSDNSDSDDLDFYKNIKIPPKIKTSHVNKERENSDLKKSGCVTESVKKSKHHNTRSPDKKKAKLESSKSSSTKNGYRSRSSNESSGESVICELVVDEPEEDKSPVPAKNNGRSKENLNSSPVRKIESKKPGPWSKTRIICESSDGKSAAGQAVQNSKSKKPGPWSKTRVLCDSSDEDKSNESNDRSRSSARNKEKSNKSNNQSPGKKIKKSKSKKQDTSVNKRRRRSTSESSELSESSESSESGDYDSDISADKNEKRRSLRSKSSLDILEEISARRKAALDKLFGMKGDSTRSPVKKVEESKIKKPGLVIRRRSSSSDSYDSNLIIDLQDEDEEEDKSNKSTDRSQSKNKENKKKDDIQSPAKKSEKSMAMVPSPIAHRQRSRSPSKYSDSDREISAGEKKGKPKGSANHSPDKSHRTSKMNTTNSSPEKQKKSKDGTEPVAEKQPKEKLDSEKPGPSTTSHFRKSSSDSGDVRDYFPKNDDKTSDKSSSRLSTSDFETDGTTRSKLETISNRMPYNKKEDEMIVRYLMVRNRLSRIGGNVLWTDLEKSSDNFNRRTYQSLKNRFKRNIKPFLLTRWRHALTEDNIRMVLRTFPELKKTNHLYDKINFPKTPKVIVEEISDEKDKSDSETLVERERVFTERQEKTPVKRTVENEKNDSPKNKQPSQKENGHSSRKNEPPARENDDDIWLEIYSSVKKLSPSKNDLHSPRSKLPARQNDVQSPRRNLFASQNDLQSPRSNLPANQNDLRSPRRNLPASQNDLQSPRSKLPASQNDLRSPRPNPPACQNNASPKNKLPTKRRIKYFSPRNRQPERKDDSSLERRIEDSGEESDLIKDTPEEVLLARQAEKNNKSGKEKESERKISYVDKATQYYSDEETQLPQEKLDEILFSDQTKKTENLNVIVDNNVEENVPPGSSQSLLINAEENIPQENSQSLCLPADFSKRDPDPTRNESLNAFFIDGNLARFRPLYRCSKKTKMDVNLVLGKLDRIVNKRKRPKKRAELAVTLPKPEEVAKEEVSEAGTTSTVSDSLFQTLIQAAQDLYSDSDSEVEHFVKNIKDYEKSKKINFSFSSLRIQNKQRLPESTISANTNTDIETETSGSYTEDEIVCGNDHINISFDGYRNSTPPKNATKNPVNGKCELNNLLQANDKKSGLLGNMFNMINPKDKKK